MKRAKDTKDESGVNIRVILRCRPPTSQEMNTQQVIECLPQTREVNVKRGPGILKSYNFDGVCNQNTTQELIFKRYGSPVIDEVLQGFNCTIFAYGQTGTGKTYTMEGDMSPVENGLPSEYAGIIPRSVFYVFDKLKRMSCEYTVRVSYLEIYQEELSDLLNANDDGKNLRIFEEGRRGVGGGSVVSVDKLEEVPVSSPKDAIELMQSALRRRRTAETLMNARSSRSHCIFTTTVMMREVTPDGLDVLKIGKLNLVDLAGSENIQRSGAQGGRAKEAGMINQSLLTLGRVINALVDHNSYVPFRDSKLTRLLQDSLGGKTKTCIIATVSPSSANLEESLSTLDYASRAKNIKNQPELNQKVAQRVAIKEMSGEIERLQQELLWAREKTGVYISNDRYTQMENDIQQLQDKLSVAEGELAECKELYVQKTAEYEENDFSNRKRAEQIVSSVTTGLKKVEQKQHEIERSATTGIQSVDGVLSVAGEAITNFATSVGASVKKAEDSLNPMLKAASKEASQSTLVITNEIKSSKSALDSLHNLSASFQTTTAETAKAVKNDIETRVIVNLCDVFESFSENTNLTVRNATDELSSLNAVLKSVAATEHKEICDTIQNELSSRVGRLEKGIEKVAKDQMSQLDRLQEMMCAAVKTCKDVLTESINQMKQEVNSVRSEMTQLEKRVESGFTGIENSRHQVEQHTETVLSNIGMGVTAATETFKTEASTEIRDSIQATNKKYEASAADFALETDRVRIVVDSALDKVSSSASTSSAIMDKTTKEVSAFISSSLAVVARDAQHVGQTAWKETRQCILTAVDDHSQVVTHRAKEMVGETYKIAAFAHDTSADIIKHSVTIGAPPPSPLAIPPQYLNIAPLSHDSDENFSPIPVQRSLSCSSTTNQNHHDPTPSFVPHIAATGLPPKHGESQIPMSTPSRGRALSQAKEQNKFQPAPRDVSTATPRTRTQLKKVGLS